MALLPPPDIGAAYVDTERRPSKDFYNWIKSLYDSLRGVVSGLGAFDSLYEEGAWTPEITFGGGNAGLTYDFQSGVYTRIGRMVAFHGIVAINTTGSSTGDAVLGGLPFTIGNIDPVFNLKPNSATIDTTNEDSFYYLASGFNGTTTAALLVVSGGGDTPLGEWFFVDGSSLHISGQYFA